MMTSRFAPLLLIAPLLLSGCAAETAMDGSERDALKVSVLELSEEVRQLRETVDALRKSQQPAPTASAAMNQAMQAALAPPATPAAKPRASTNPVGAVVPLTQNPPPQPARPAQTPPAPRSILPTPTPPSTTVSAPPIPPSSSSGGSRYGNLPDALPPANSVDEAAAMLLPLMGGQAGSTKATTTTPPASSTPAPEPTNAASMEPPPSTTQTSSADALLGDAASQVGIHLVSLRQPEAAQRAWTELRSRYADVLGSLQHRVSAIDFGDGRGTFYRLKAGPFADHAAAEQACVALRAKGAYCGVSDFLGTGAS